MLISFFIDLAEGVKPVIHPKSAKFLRKIIIKKLKEIIIKVQEDILDLIL